MAGQTTVRVFRRTCCWLAERRPVLSEGYLVAGEGGTTKMRESSMKDMLVAGQTTVRVFRRTCCWLAEQRPVLSEGYVGGCRRGDDKRLTTEGVPALRCQEYDCWKQWYLERARDNYCRGRCETAPRGAIGAKSARTVGSKSCLKRARDKYFFRGRCETAPRGAKNARTVGGKRGGATRSAGSRENETPR